MEKIIGQDRNSQGTKSRPHTMVSNQFWLLAHRQCVQRQSLPRTTPHSHRIQYPLRLGPSCSLCSQEKLNDVLHPSPGIKKIKRHSLKVLREASATTPVSDLSLNFQEGRKKITGLGEDEGERMEVGGARTGCSKHGSQRTTGHQFSK